MSDAGKQPSLTLMEHRCRKLPPWLAGLVALTSVMVLAGWAVGSARLKSVAPGLTTMKINTAIGLLLGALAIMARCLPWTRWRWTTYLFAAPMALIGVLTLLEYTCRIDLHIDNVFLFDRETPVYPGRLAPATAVSFIGFAVAMFLLREGRALLVGQLLLLVASLPHWTSIGGYVFGAPGMYFHVPYPAVALHTAISLLLLCAAGLLQFPDKGFMRVITSGHLAGGVSRTLLPLGAALPLIVGVSVVTGQAAGWYTERFAFSLLATTCAVLFIAATWWTTWLLLEREIDDIARRKTYEDQLRGAKDVAEAASRAKDQFLAVLSHELRTPLTPVLATVELMQRDPDLTEDTRESVEMIRRNVELEARLIDDLLDLTRIARGKIKLHHEAFDVHSAIETTLQTLQSEIATRNLKLTLSLTAVDRTVWADPTRFQQVLWNLIGNAIKFTAEAGEISVRTFNESDDRLIIRISDTGVGIEPQMLPRLFNAFEQGERTISRRFGGLGLGLSISKSLLEMHGGTITAESGGKGRGATFTISVTAMKLTDIVSKVDRTPSASAVPAGTMAQKRILLVEDNNDTLKIMKLLLKKLGFEVVTATGVQAALELGNHQRFDLLVSDIGLPDGSGWDIIKSLKQTQNIRGVAISGFGMEEDLQRSKEAGFAQHLVKPVSFELLRDVVREVAESPS